MSSDIRNGTHVFYYLNPETFNQWTTSTVSEIIVSQYI